MEVFASVSGGSVSPPLPFCFRLASTSISPPLLFCLRLVSISVSPPLPSCLRLDVDLALLDFTSVLGRLWQCHVLVPSW